MTPFQFRLDRARNLSMDRRLSESDREALVAVIVAFDRARHLISRYLAAGQGAGTEPVAAVDLDAAQFVAEVAR